MMQEEAAWSQQMFGGCALGDTRRTARLVDVARRMASQLGQSLARCCEGDAAAMLGSYRLLRNAQVEPEAIRAGGFTRVAEQVQAHRLLLAVEDTTSVSYTHAGAQTLGALSNHKDAKRRGYEVHSVLLLDADSEHTLGLIEQQVWCREAAAFGKKHQRKQRPYVEKESYKWERASQQVALRLGTAMSHTISVCDRESDVYEYLAYKHQHQQRFVVRSQTDRCVAHPDHRLWRALDHSAPRLTTYTVQIPQRAGRKARQATLELRSITLDLEPSRANQAVPMNVVLAQEIDAPAGVEALRWVLLTSEAVAQAHEALKVVHCYSLRWRIEEFHKAWKSGIGVERQRFQEPANLERMLAITAFLAVRLLQLREHLQVPADAPEPTCGRVLSETEWKVLWHSTERTGLPIGQPSARWAYRAIAKLGGFADTKRTGRPGWDTIWHGWFRLQERVEGYLLSQQGAKEM